MSPWWLVLIIPASVLGTLGVSVALQMWFWKDF
jgi:hypothetical protein